MLQTNEHPLNVREEEIMKNSHYNKISESVTGKVTPIYTKKVISIWFENQMGKDRKTYVREVMFVGVRKSR